MLETPHVAVGAAIAAKIPNPIVSIPLAFGSHFVLERVPHWNPHLNTETKKHGRPTNLSTAIVVVDVLLALGTGFYVANTASIGDAHATTILASSFFSVLPDVIEGPYFFLGMRGSKLIKKWIAFQSSIQNDTSPLPGMLTQVITYIAALAWIFN